MKIVNRSNLPYLVYKFLEQDFYDSDASKGTISATTFLKPLQEIILTERYSDKIEVDSIDRIWSLFGSGIHAVLEKIEDSSIENIERVYADVLGEKVSGKWDVLKDNTLTDYKVTSVWSYIFGSRKNEHKTQLSIYRWLYYKQKNVVLNDEGNIILIFRDWAERDKEKDGYPEKPILEIKYKLYSFEAVEKFLTKKVGEIQKSRKLKDEELPECTNEQRWYNKRTGKFNKCFKYCLAKDYCVQLKNMIEQKGTNGTKTN